MKKYLFVFLLLFFHFFSHAQNKKDLNKKPLALTEVRVCWFHELTSFHLKLMRSPWDNQTYIASGDLGNFIKDTFAEQKINVTNYSLSMKRCLAKMKSGKIDMIPYLGENDAFKKIGIFNSNPIGKSNRILIYSKTKFPNPPVLKNESDLKKYSYGGLSGWNYSFFAPIKKVSTDSFNRKQLYQKLRRGRFDFIPEMKDVFDNEVETKKVKDDDLGYVPNPYEPEAQLYALISKKNVFAKKIAKIMDDAASKAPKVNP